MLARKRDHAAAYRRRIERGLALGLTRAQARGHAPAGHSSVSGRHSSSHEVQLERALKLLRTGRGTLSSIAADAHVSRERLSRYIKTHAGAHRERGQWRFNDQRLRQIAIVEEGHGAPVKFKVVGFEAAHEAGLHAYEAGRVLEDQALAPEFIRRWEGRRIKDARGRWHTFSTDINQLYQALHAHRYEFEKFYQIAH